MNLKLLYLSVLFVVPSVFFTQNFTWLRGHNTSGPITGTYGVQGTASVTNDPGHRHGAATWVDASGNLWMFGGEGISSTTPISWLNDLWKYNPSSNQWTWIRGSNGPNAVGNYGTQGVAANSNEPGAREFANFWTDASGNFWLFGGDGYASNTTFGRLGDLWKYNPSTNQWTWMKGFNVVDQNGMYGTIGVANSSNLPGSRLASGTWVDASGNFWMFGGKGFGATGLDGNLCDLWKYSSSTNNWTWVHGSNAITQAGVYGTLGTPSVTNNPGGREHPTSWFDASTGNLFLFAGRGLSTGPGSAYLNDLWKYNPTNDTWAWLHGSNTNNPLANYGTQAVPNNANVPGGRYASGMWTDAAGNFWVFGGLGWIATSSLANLNDLWKYEPSTNQWTWMKGSNNVNASGIYGTVGVANANNFPGARHYNVTWRNLNSKLWLFGGEGIDNNNQNPQDNMNDMWGYSPPCNPDSISAANNNICNGNTATLTAYNQYSANVSWFNSPTSSTSIGSGSTLTSVTLIAATSPSVYNYYAQANNCTLTPRTLISITVNPLPTIVITGSNTVCSGANLTLSASGANTYTWSTGANSASTIVNPLSNVSYTVQGATVNNCVGSSVKTVSVLPSPSISISGTNQACSGASLVLSGSGATTYTWNTNSNSSTIAVAPTITSNYTLNGTDNIGCVGTSVKSITVLALPTLTATAIRPVFCKVDINTLTVSGANNYTWSAPVSSVFLTSTNIANVLISVQTNSASGTIIFTIIGSDANGCIGTNTVSAKWNNCVSITENEWLISSIHVFPNPNSGTFIFKNETALENLSLEIFNGLGQQVFISELDKNEIEIKSGLANGIYFYVIKQKQQTLQEGKIIIE